MKNPVHKLAVLWYPDEVTYSAFKKVCADRESHFGIPYSAWLEMAAKNEAAMTARGQVLVKIEASPEEFLAWCSQKSRASDSNSRATFAAEKLIMQLKAEEEPISQ